MPRKLKGPGGILGLGANVIEAIKPLEESEVNQLIGKLGLNEINLGFYNNIDELSKSGSGAAANLIPTGGGAAANLIPTGGGAAANLIPTGVGAAAAKSNERVTVENNSRVKDMRFIPGIDMEACKAYLKDESEQNITIRGCIPECVGFSGELIGSLDTASHAVGYGLAKYFINCGNYEEEVILSIYYDRTWTRGKAKTAMEMEDIEILLERIKLQNELGEKVCPRVFGFFILKDSDVLLDGLVTEESKSGPILFVYNRLIKALDFKFLERLLLINQNHAEYEQELERIMLELKEKIRTLVEPSKLDEEFKKFEEYIFQLLKSATVDDSLFWKDIIYKYKQVMTKGYLHFDMNLGNILYSFEGSDVNRIRFIDWDKAQHIISTEPLDNISLRNLIYQTLNKVIVPLNTRPTATPRRNVSLEPQKLFGVEGAGAEAGAAVLGEGEKILGFKNRKKSKKIKKKHKSNKKSKSNKKPKSNKKSKSKKISRAN